MANVKISDLPLIANIPPTAGVFPIVYNNVTYKMDWSQLNNQITASGANPLNITGTGTTGTITKWTTGGSVIGDSIIADDGSTITVSGNIKIPNSGTIGSIGTNNAITILSGGQVGIGGTPSYLLHVSGNIIAVEDSAPAFRLIGTAGSAKIFDLKNDDGIFKIRDVNSGRELYHLKAGASGYHNWYINDSLKMTLDSSGNVGIGTNSPYTKLQVDGGNISVLSNSTTGTDGASDVRTVGFGFKHPNNTVLSALINTTPSGTWGLNLHFNTRASNAVMPTIPAMTIDGSGNVLIGTTTDNGYKLDVNGTGRFSGNVNINKTTPQLILDGRGSGNSGAAVQFLGWVSGQVNWQLGNAIAGTGFQIRASATAGSNDFATVAEINGSTGVYTATSDVNKKKDFEESEIGLKEVMELQPKLYRMKTESEDSNKHLGFIAQEVKEYIPQAYVEQGEDDDKFIGLTEMPIIAALTKAIQEQQAQIEELKSEIQLLKNN